jgi:hypothetical protein
VTLVNVLLSVLLFSSCGVPYALVSGRYVSSDANFAVDLPEGWRQHNASFDSVRVVKETLEKRRKLDWDVIRLTRDGLLLQQIGIGRIPITEELPHTKRKFAQNMIALEAAELISDNFRSNTNLNHQEIVENAPATLGGYPGFKLHYSYRTEEELKLEGLLYGALVGDWLYYIVYEAPAQHYFAKDVQLFERTRSSLDILKTAPAK